MQPLKNQKYSASNVGCGTGDEVKIVVEVAIAILVLLINSMEQLYQMFTCL
jgi:hypothetical protein